MRLGALLQIIALSFGVAVVMGGTAAACTPSSVKPETPVGTRVSDLITVVDVGDGVRCYMTPVYLGKSISCVVVPK